MQKNNYDKTKYAVLLADQNGIVIKYNLIECYVESAPTMLCYVSAQFTNKKLIASIFNI